MKFVQFIVLALISLAVPGRCIYGGVQTRIEEVPYQVMIKVKKDETNKHMGWWNKDEKYKLICGGALIQPNIVLTAAHCIDKLSKLGSKVFVVAGTSYPKSNPKEIVAEKMKTYPKYNDNSADSVYFDLGLIKLDGNFPVSNTIKPVNLPTKTVEVGHKVLVSGMGRGEKNNEEMTDLKSFLTTIVQCEFKNMQNLVMRNAIICHTNTSGYRTMKGDSGGPMVNGNKELVGIHTHSSLSNTYQQATNVHHYLKWIKDTINELLKNKYTPKSFT